MAASSKKNKIGKLKPKKSKPKKVRSLSVKKSAPKLSRRANRQPAKTPRISLSPAAIEALKANGCSASDWKKIRIHPETDLSLIRNVQFFGKIEIGLLKSKETLKHPDAFGAEVFHPHLTDLKLENVSIGDHNVIARVGVIRNVVLGDRNILCDVAEIVCDLKSAFGVDAPVEVGNENGGRVVGLAPDLGAARAWLAAFRKEDASLQKILAGWTQSEARHLRGQPGRIGNANLIRHCGLLRNVAIGNGSFVEGAAHLEDGTVVSEIESPARVFGALVARHFILQKKSEVLGPARIDSGLVGEGVSFGKGASLSNSFLFSNSEAHRSELSSAFAGPFTVTHHQSTLLIAGVWSFYNAGSGTNGSNHRYRLGPVHQGRLLRGAKSGSLSQISWPAQVGAFSTVVGGHGGSFDSTDFPFSLLVGEGSKTRLYPGHCVFSAGQFRDETKWSLRDKRPSSSPLDVYHTQRLSPYTMSAVVRGMEKIAFAKSALASSKEKSGDWVNLDGFLVSRKSLEIAAGRYQTLLRFYLAGVIFREVKNGALKTKAWPKWDAAGSVGEWTDLAGILMPTAKLESLCQEIKTRRIDGPEAFSKALSLRYASYAKWEKEWVWEIIPHLDGVNDFREPKTFFAALSELAATYYANVREDAMKDFSDETRFSYGQAGDVEGDYRAIRGRSESNATLRDLDRERDEILKMIKSAASR